jgi:hypothetical protein
MSGFPLRSKSDSAIANLRMRLLPGTICNLILGSSRSKIPACAVEPEENRKREKDGESQSVSKTQDRDRQTNL